MATGTFGVVASAQHRPASKNVTSRSWLPAGALQLVLCLALLFGPAGCRPAPVPAAAPPPVTPTGTAAPAPAATPVPPAATPAPLPTLALEETSARDFAIADFAAAHAPVEGDANKFLIYGNLPVSRPAAGLPPELAVFLGRWEGYGDTESVKKDQKVVMVVQEITAQGGRAFGWAGANLQYPTYVQDLRFRVVPGAAPAIEWQFETAQFGPQITTFTYDPATGHLRGQVRLPRFNFTGGNFDLSHGRAFYVYEDYARYLAGLGIYAQSYQDRELQKYGQGYLLYLPEGYAEHPEQSWPLIFFLHGAGDRGANVFLLAKASPFMMIREHGPLPAIIAAPLLSATAEYPAFPDDYVAGALAEIRAAYRVDPARVYATGLSLGGIATYRLAMRQPATLAAIAPLSTAADAETLAQIARLKDVPVWAIQGDGDTVFPLARARQAPDALAAAGGNVQFTVLAGHDHDTWTDTYADPAFYQWLLRQRRP